MVITILLQTSLIMRVASILLLAFFVVPKQYTEAKYGNGLGSYRRGLLFWTVLYVLTLGTQTFTLASVIFNTQTPSLMASFSFLASENMLIGSIIILFFYRKGGE